jgi:hypothetical protein
MRTRKTPFQPQHCLHIPKCRRDYTSIWASEMKPMCGYDSRQRHMNGIEIACHSRPVRIHQAVTKTWIVANQFHPPCSADNLSNPNISLYVYLPRIPRLRPHHRIVGAHQCPPHGTPGGRCSGCVKPQTRRLNAKPLVGHHRGRNKGTLAKHLNLARRKSISRGSRPVLSMTLHRTHMQARLAYGDITQQTTLDRHSIGHNGINHRTASRLVVHKGLRIATHYLYEMSDPNTNPTIIIPHSPCLRSPPPKRHLVEFAYATR